MPYSAQHKQATRRRILESARRLFNTKGFAEVSIDEVMDHAGLTRGGFYRHFRDKAELYAEAVRWFTCPDAPKPWQKPQRRAKRKTRTQCIVDAYFSADHLVDRETSCPMLTLSTDIAHSSEAVRSAYGHVLKTMLDVFAGDLAKREQALALAALCVGGMVLARNIEEAALSDAVRGAAYRQAQTMLKAPSC
jgi:TetR/AcrR family transcriptional regulator, transcriptional repressor for nem operon